MKKGCFLFIAVFLARMAIAQEPGLVSENIKFTKSVIENEKNHLIVFVDMESEPKHWVHYRYDHYTDVERIIDNDGASYARPKGKEWLKSGDWGETGAPVDKDKEHELQTLSEIPFLPFQEFENHDKGQGAGVWKFVKNREEKDVKFFVFEYSREKPNPGGYYPHYTFVKYKHDTDGSLLLTKCECNLRDGDRLIPLTIDYQYMFRLPADTKIIYGNNRQ